MRKPPRRIRRRPATDPFPGVDVQAAARIAELLALVRIDGREVPFVRPHRDVEDHADFDAMLCGAGVKAFARERMPSDWPDFVENPGSHVFVTELEPGARYRQPAMVTLDHEMN